MNIIIGRKDIMTRLKVLDWGTVRKWKREYKLPIRYMPNNKPFILPDELNKWLIVYSERQKKRAAL
jgi:hypothetical protein